jgi:hypothetical protein
MDLEAFVFLPKLVVNNALAYPAVSATAGSGSFPSLRIQYLPAHQNELFSRNEQ